MQKPKIKVLDKLQQIKHDKKEKLQHKNAFNELKQYIIDQIIEKSKSSTDKTSSEQIKSTDSKIVMDKLVIQDPHIQRMVSAASNDNVAKEKQLLVNESNSSSNSRSKLQSKLKDIKSSSRGNRHTKFNIDINEKITKELDKLIE